MKKNVGRKFTENEKRLFAGLTLSGDGDLAHLSEGISDDLAYFYTEVRGNE